MKTIVAFVAALLCAAVSLAGPGAATHITAEGHTFATGPTMFVGEATFHLDGVPHTVLSTTNLLSTRELPDGVIIFQTSHTFDFGAGDTLVTHDHGRMVPTADPGLYELHSQLTIVEGTGAFAGARGHLRGQPGSTIDLVKGEAMWTTIGVVTLR